MSIEETLAERGTRYGDFTNHADICDVLINVCSGTGYGPQTNFSTLDPVKRQAIRVICDKLARILSPGGDPEYRDNWHDIQGYAKLAEDRCKDGDAAQQAELLLDTPVDPVMPELRAKYSDMNLDSGEYVFVHEYMESNPGPGATGDALLRT